MSLRVSPFFFFNDTATTEIYTLSLHDALPISWHRLADRSLGGRRSAEDTRCLIDPDHLRRRHRSEEHTSELQSPDHLVCRLLLEKKKQIYPNYRSPPPNTHHHHTRVSLSTSTP